MIFVSNSGTIISFARAGHLELLRKVLKRVTIPVGAYEEIVIGGKGKPGAEEVEKATWIKVKKPKNQGEIERLKEKLHQGEAEAIVLAQELKASLLIDDLAARKQAEKRGIVFFGSLRVLKEAKHRKIIKEIRPIGDELRKTGLRIKDSLYQRFLLEVGE